MAYANSLERAIDNALLAGRNIRSRIDMVGRGIIQDKQLRAASLFRRNIGGLVYREVGSVVRPDSSAEFFERVGTVAKFRYPARLDAVNGQSGFNVIVGEGLGFATGNIPIPSKNIEAVIINLNSQQGPFDVLGTYQGFSSLAGAPVFVDTGTGVFEVHGQTCSVYSGDLGWGC